MERQNGRVEPGQRMRGMSARAWNRAQDAADIVLGASPGVSADSQSYTSAPFTSVLAKRDGLDMTMGYAYSISGMETSVDNMWQMPVLKTSTPYYGGSIVQYCVAVEPIGADKVGRVAVDGVVPAWVRIQDESHTCANYGSWGGGDTPSLFSSHNGTSQILYKSDRVFDSQYLCLIKLNARMQQIRSGTVIMNQGSGTWSKGMYVSVLLNDASGFTSQVVGVINNMQSKYVYHERVCYVFSNGSGFELLAVDAE